MPALTFSCPNCSEPITFEYSDYCIKDYVKNDSDCFEILQCKCGKKLKTVPWVAVFDEDENEPITFV